MKHLQTYNTFLNENTSPYDKLLKIAKGVDYDTFLKKTDSLTSFYNILYRGGDLTNHCFMTDYIGHAKSYSDVVVGIIYDNKDVLNYNDTIFSNLRKSTIDLTKKDLTKIYKEYFDNGKLFDAMVGDYETEKGVINFVYKFIHSDISYTSVQQNKIKNDLLIPIMEYYANTINKYIISFWGNDYSDFGGAAEFVVSDVSKYITLKEIWTMANKKN